MRLGDRSNARNPQLAVAAMLIGMVAIWGGGAFAASDLDGDGYTEAEGDCNDDNDEVFPGAPAQCDLQDNDCDGNLEPDELIDDDLDGWPLCADCADEEAAVNPGASEICDGRDNNCDFLLLPDEDVDVDMDSYPLCDDCNDLAPAIHPGAEEQCNGLDDDCDTWLVLEEVTDVDGDFALACIDCDDYDIDVSPWYGEWELCDGIDNNCDGDVPAWEQDSDGDGFRLCNGDCDDSNPAVWGKDWAAPESNGAPEVCDGIDNNCDGAVDDMFQFDAPNLANDQQNSTGITQFRRVWL